MYAYLYSCEGYDTTSDLTIAGSWIHNAKSKPSHLGCIPHEVYQWEEIIEKHNTETMVVPLTGLMLDGTEEAIPSEATIEAEGCEAQPRAAAEHKVVEGTEKNFQDERSEFSSDPHDMQE